MPVGANAGVVHPELDAPVGAGAGSVLESGEARLALHPLEHHAPRDRYRDLLGLEFLAALETIVLEQPCRPVARTLVVRVGDALFAQARELGAALRDDLVLVGGAGRRARGLVAHWLRLPLSGWRR